MPFSVYVLSICTATAFTCASLLITLSALIGAQLAPDKSLATLPIALQFLAVMTVSLPASQSMAVIGRRNGFMLAACIGMVGAIIALVAIIHKNFWAFCAAAFLFGTFTAFANFYRFAAIEAVDESMKNRAISFVMAGGVIAAFFGPNLANLSKNMLNDYPFAGPFLILFLVYLLNLILISRLQLPRPVISKKSYTGRPLWTIVSQPVFVVAIICEMLGYGSMNLIMSSTPLAMHAHDHGLGSTSQVIQWHVVAMFLPSFFTGRLIDRFGIFPVLAVGALLGFVAVAINLSGYGFIQFVAGLVALGVCWNFLFVGGTTLLTQAYEQEEKSRVQGINDLIVFTFVTFTALSAGTIHHWFGWIVVNLTVVPLYAIVLIAIILLHRTQRHQKDQQQVAG